MLHNASGCEVHAFDPTRSFAPQPMPGVFFHSLGLRDGFAARAGGPTTNAAEYGAIDPATGATTLLGTIDGANSHINDLAYHPGCP